MNLELTAPQKELQAECRHFASHRVAPHADDFDRREFMPADVIREVAANGYLAAFLKPEWSGRGLDFITYGLLTEELGRACSSLRSLLTVHDMVALSILKWGTNDQREAWLRRLALGQTIGAVAITEAGAGSDAASVQLEAKRVNGSYVLNGKKKWITFGQIADLFLVLAQCESRPAAFLVERERAGFQSNAISGLLGVRASMVADLTFANCEIPAENLIGREGFGLASVISTALGLARYSVAWGSVGIAQSCLEACLDYTSERKQFGVYLKEHQLIKQMLTGMIVNVNAARLLCVQAGAAKVAGDPKEVQQTFIAKYFASRTAMKAATDAVQIHGANGCGGEYPVQRYLRDAKIMEIIEGSNQIQQITIADCAFQERAWAAAARALG